MNIKVTHQKSKQRKAFLTSYIRTQKVWILIQEKNENVCPAYITKKSQVEISEHVRKSGCEKNFPPCNIMISPITLLIRVFCLDSATHHWQCQRCLHRQDPYIYNTSAQLNHPYTNKPIRQYIQHEWNSISNFLINGICKRFICNYIKITVKCYKCELSKTGILEEPKLLDHLQALT